MKSFKSVIFIIICIVVLFQNNNLLIALAPSSTTAGQIIDSLRINFSSADSLGSAIINPESDEDFKKMMNNMHTILSRQEPEKLAQFNQAYTILQQYFGEQGEMIDYHTLLFQILFDNTLHFEAACYEGEMIGAGVYTEHPSFISGDYICMDEKKISELSSAAKNKISSNIGAKIIKEYIERWQNEYNKSVIFEVDREETTPDSEEAAISKDEKLKRKREKKIRRIRIKLYQRLGGYIVDSEYTEPISGSPMHLMIWPKGEYKSFKKDGLNYINIKNDFANEIISALNKSVSYEYLLNKISPDFQETSRKFMEIGLMHSAA